MHKEVPEVGLAKKTTQPLGIFSAEELQELGGLMLALGKATT